MTNLYKLIFWTFCSMLVIYILRLGYIESADRHVCHLRNMYTPSFAYHYDDYLPYLPLVAMILLKCIGVKSRNSWKQMLVSTLFSAILMGIVVLSMKTIAGVFRPDGSDFFSFPSGHTATAFTAASLLRKEYGFNNRRIAAWAYLPAILTGFSRMLNNRHWLSDVMAGAVIGVMVVEWGYYLAGLLFKKRGRVNSINGRLM